ncbi:MAG: purine-nucleoside phosphorylase [Nautiliaceae bacterium]
MIISAGNEEVFDFALPIGIGLIESAINLTRLCLFEKPEFLIFIGSAGSYGKLKIFDIVESKSASNIEHCFLKKECYSPLDNIISIGDVSRETVINSSNYITTSKLISKAYLHLGIEAENMEFYSVLKVAKEFQIPVKGIFIITNYCDENAHKDYMQNIKKAKEKLIKYLENKKIIKETK